MASLLVNITCGPENPTKATLAFFVAAAAIEAGHTTHVFLAGDAVQLVRQREAQGRFAGRGGPDERDRAVTRLLQPPRREHLHEVAVVQAWTGRVEADVERHRAGLEMSPQVRLIGGQGNQPAPLQLVPHVRHEASP